MGTNKSINVSRSAAQDLIAAAHRRVGSVTTETNNVKPNNFHGDSSVEFGAGETIFRPGTGYKMENNSLRK